METIFNFKSTADLVDLIDYGSMTEIIRSSRAGWTKGITAVDDLLQDLNINIEPKKFQKEFFPTVEGLFYDIGLICSGVPEHWFNPQEDNNGSFLGDEHNSEKDIIRLNVNTTFSSDIPIKVIVERGAAVAVLAYLLERSGRAVSISQYCAISKNNQNFYGSLKIKEANQLLDMNSLSFWLVCPNSFYGCWYRVIESLPNAHKFGVQNGHYGSPEVNYGKDQSDIFLEGLNDNSKTWSRSDSVEWIKKKLESLDIKFNQI